METPEFISRRVRSGDYYFLDLEPDPRKSLVIVCGGREQCDSSYHLHRRTFPYWSIEYVVSGQGRVTINGDSFPIGPGTLFRYGPGIAHSIEVEDGSVLDKAFVDFVGARVADWWIGPWETLRPLHVLASAGVRAVFESLHRYGRRGGAQGTRLCALLTEEIAALAVEEAVEIDRSYSAAWATYVRCRNEIEAHYLKFRTLGEMAERCHVGEAWLCRVFAQFDAESPYQFLVKRKMAHAASRLADPALLIKEVAAEIGYDPYHFSRTFKKVTGFSPETFRRAVGPRSS